MNQLFFFLGVGGDCVTLGGYFTGMYVCTFELNLIPYSTWTVFGKAITVLSIISWLT